MTREEAIKLLVNVTIILIVVQIWMSEVEKNDKGRSND